MINQLMAALIFLVAIPLSKADKLTVKTIELNTKNTITINSVFTTPSVEKAISEIKELDNLRGNQNYPLYLVLESPGGSIFAGNRLIRYAKTVKNLHTICIVCISMAHATVQGLPGTRYATTDNVTMAHPASLTIQGRFEQEELKTLRDVLNSLNKHLGKVNANRIGISYETYKKKVRFEWWTVGDESIEQNIVDELVNLKCTKELEDKKYTTKQMTMFGLVDGPERSACPLL